MVFFQKSRFGMILGKAGMGNIVKEIGERGSGENKQDRKTEKKDTDKKD